jgi:hypothetical protein
MSEGGFFSRILGGGANEDETRIISPEELRRKEPARREEPEEERSGGFTVERAAEIIDDLPPDVSRESALRIVRGTLTAAGVRVEDLERSTRMREAKLGSEIEFAQSRQRELQERTDETVRSLEEEIRRAHEARESSLAEEKERLTRASVGLENIKRVRAFFGFPEVEEEASPEPAYEPSADETQVLGSFDDDRTQVLRRPGETNQPDTRASEDSSPRHDPYGTTER